MIGAFTSLQYYTTRTKTAGSLHAIDREERTGRQGSEAGVAKAGVASRLPHPLLERPQQPEAGGRSGIQDLSREVKNHVKRREAAGEYSVDYGRDRGEESSEETRGRG